MAADNLEDLFEPKTKQWTAREVIIVNGIDCCYTVIKNEGFLVHLPGGQKRFAHEMLFEGHTVILPDHIRGCRK
jgi:hypothetical protein